MSIYPAVGKRLLDLAVSIPAVLILSPILLATAGLVRLKLGSPVLYRQVRPGLHGRPFTILKFRTMSDARDASGALLPDAKRMTRFGRLLRSWSLDELPELWNVIAGDMSLVGPRPLLMQYLERYSPEQRRRHDVRPGLTGLAQVEGRNALSWSHKFQLDVQYVDRLSLALDLRILARTVLSVLSRRGINRGGHATAPEFMGSSEE